jgi:glycosyltransferase involved in cell wall biosynthesis
MNRILVIIPALNAESTLGNLIQKIRSHLIAPPYACDILVVDDGSSDKTVTIASENKTTSVSHKTNLGKGEALKTGFQFAVTHEYDTMVTIDADLQHDPAILADMLNFYLDGSYDMVVGSRSFDIKKMPFLRILSNRITSGLMSFRTGLPIPDSQSGYRIIRTEAVKDLKLKTSRYELESEMLIKMAQKKVRMGLFPITTIYGSEKSHIRHFRDTLRFIKMYIHSFF